MGEIFTVWPDDVIDNFSGDYRFLSNFGLPGFFYMGVWYRTNEHFYQAAKAETFGGAAEIVNAKTPGEAKRLGRQVEMRADWEVIKDDVMRLGLALKFARGTKAADQLLDTGDRLLIEGNTWGDTYWGVCKSEGLNKLGLMLMHQRSYLRSGVRR